MSLLRTAARASVAARTVGNVQRRQQQRWGAQDAAAAAPTAAAAASPSPAPGPPPGAGGADILGQLQQLGQLRDAGVLTEAEFEAQKARILASS